MKDGKIGRTGESNEHKQTDSTHCLLEGGKRREKREKECVRKANGMSDKSRLNSKW